MFTDADVRAVVLDYLDSHEFEAVLTAILENIVNN